MRFELKVAWRYVTTSPGQTGLTVGAVAIAVAVIVFINCLLNGVQQRLIRDVVGSLPHVTVKVPDPEPRVPADSKEVLYAARVQKQLQQRQEIRRPQEVEQLLATFSGVRVVSAAVTGQAALIRGVRQFGVRVNGANPVKQEGIVGLTEDMVSGRWLDIGPEDVVIGYKLAEEAGISVGSRIRLSSSEGVTDTFRVAGIFDTGNVAVDEGQVFVTLPAAQRLFATGKDATSIVLKLEDPWDADQAATLIRDSLGYETESWLVEQAQIVNAFAAQNSTRLMISGFVLLASAFGIASVLIVSVFRRAREIGILKSMGATDAQIVKIFTLQALFISLIGAGSGALAGYLLLKFLMQFKQVARFGKTDQLFPAVIEPWVFGLAMAAAVVTTMLASVLPARQAARTNPVEVILEG